MGEGTFDQTNLFELTMKKRWSEVLDIYIRCPEAHEAILTKSEETALHIAVSSYHARRPTNMNSVLQMVEKVPDKVLSMPNIKGDTPLHLAAAVGWVAACEKMANKKVDLMRVRNKAGETPLFIAAHHGWLETFLCLHELCKDRNVELGPEPVESLCRREDGNTILHSAIVGEYFKLAYQIISYYPKLVYLLNVDGESPLHVLARKPNAFRSSSHFGLYESIIHYSAFVPKPKKEVYDRQTQKDCTSGGQNSYPENYNTCVAIFRFLWRPIVESYRGVDCKNLLDEESQQGNGNVSQNDEKNGARTRRYPPNYTTCVRLFKFMMKVILSIIGVGFWRIKKIREKKERFSYAQQILEEMLPSQKKTYTFDGSGQGPPPRDEDDHMRVDPNKEPKTDEQRRINEGIAQDQQRINEGIAQDPTVLVKKNNGTPKKNATPLLVAAKMGIPEMVKKILEDFPVAIEDRDEHGKNVLMLAAENRQTKVIHYLLKENCPPEYMFHQRDSDGNSILHLAAMLSGDVHPWSITGDALQMQWEIKWYKYVKESLPRLSFVLNEKRETPRQTFTRTHRKLVKEANEWLIKTSESCSVVAALIAAVAFATAATVPGGLDQTTGRPIFMDDSDAFDIFSINSLMALCLSVSALIFFLAIITSRCEERDFKANLPTKLLVGLTSLFASIAAMLLSFCAGHTLILSEKLKFAAWPIYALASLPVSFFVIAQLPLYFDFLSATFTEVPLRNYKVLY